MNEELIRAMARTYRRCFGKTGLEKMLERFGVDLGKPAIEQQAAFVALGEALRGELPQHAIAVAQASAARLGSPENNADVDDEDADDATQRSMADLDAIGIYQKWNSVGKNKPGRGRQRHE